MKYLAAYLLLRAGGNAAPAADDVKSLLESVGAEADSDRLSSLISALEGKNVDEVLVFSFFSSIAICRHIKLILSL
jgi:large subunit ribosomal protein LP2